MYRFHVPTIDISAWVGRGPEAARAAVVAAVDHACRTVGFMQIVGHGVPDRVISDLEDALDGFFGLSLDAKKQYVRPAAENRGYTPPKSESLSYSLGIDPVTRMNDFFEAFNVGTSWREYPGTTATAADYAESTWPDAVPAFRPSVETYFDEARRVARTLTQIFAAALRVPDDALDALTDHSIDVLRMNNYALPPGSIELGAELTGMGEHTDFGLVTVLWADRVGSRTKGVEHISTRDGVTIGLAQSLALIPGVSRSGSTISAGMFLGFTREAAARFSFLLSIPAVVLSGLFSLKDVGGGDGVPVGPTLVATVVSFVVGYAAIAWLLRYLTSHTLVIFVIYRVALGLLLFVLLAGNVIDAR
mgnify:CR=1 FL=1